MLPSYTFTIMAEACNLLVLNGVQDFPIRTLPLNIPLVILAILLWRAPVIILRQEISTLPLLPLRRLPQEHGEYDQVLKVVLLTTPATLSLLQLEGLTTQFLTLPRLLRLLPHRRLLLLPH